jgi:hypothetical protein
MRKTISSLLLIFFYTICSAQLTHLRDFKLVKENSNMLCYKINGNKYRTDYSTVFLSDRDTIFRNSSGEAVYFMIYNNKYLVVGYFPENNHRSPLAYELRAVNRIDIIELNKRQNKWTYRFDPVISLINVTSFSPLDGTLTHVKIIRALPVSE